MDLRPRPVHSTRERKAAHSVLLLAGDGTRSRKHEAEDGVVSLFLLDQTLERVDVERDGVAMNRQDDGRATSVDDDLIQPRGVRAASGCGSTRQEDEEKKDGPRRDAPFGSRHFPAADCP